MTTYSHITIKLSKQQKDHFIKAIHDNTSLTITFRAMQINKPGDTILVTNKQLQQLNISKLTKNQLQLLLAKHKLN